MKKKTLTFLFGALVALLPAGAFADTVTDTIGVGGYPFRILEANGSLYVTNYDHSTVSVIDPDTGDVTETLTVDNGPMRMVLVGDKIYVANTLGSSVSVIDTADSNAVSDPIAVGASPREIVALGGNVYVINQGDDTVSVIDSETNTVIATVTVGQNPMSLVPYENRVYVANAFDDTVSVIDGVDFSVDAEIDVGSSPVVLFRHQGKLYVGNNGSDNVSVIDIETNVVTATVPVGDQPQYLGARANEVYVGNYSGGTVTVIDADNDTVTRTVVVGGEVYGIATFGSKAFVVSREENAVYVINALDDHSTQVLSVGTTPQGIASIGTKVYVMNSLSNTVSVIEDTEGPVIDGLVGIPERVTGESATYEFSVVSDSETEIVMTPCGPGAVAEVSEVGVNPMTATISGLEVGETYSCTILARDNSGNESETLQIGPFTRVEDEQPRRSSGRRSRSGGSRAEDVAPATTTEALSLAATSTMALPSSRDLWVGDEGEDVRELQRFLNAVGFGISSGAGSAGQETLFFGEKTREALARFQASHGVAPAAGYYGPKTRAAILSGE